MKTKWLFLFILFFVMTFFTGISVAQDEDLFPGGTYDSRIPTPLEVTGHRFGAVPTFHSEMIDFMKAVSEASDRVQLFTYGKTYQGRKLVYLVISDPANLGRLNEIKAANKRLTDPRIVTKSEADEIAGWMPSIVWLGYNIHGNEASGMEAAIRTVYQLAAGTDAVTMNILKNVVTVVDPIQNPDGRDRYNHYQRSITTLESHPQAQDVEHSSPWPGGRTNHYLFDLNRDFFLKTQIESWQRAIVYHEFMPHVFPDVHEMGTNSTYFFAPPMDPYNEYVSPLLHKWWGKIAEGNAEAFDHFGWGYYTKESFDAFYPGYGVSYPSINGSIGMTYEQASSRGVSSMRADGTILTLREASWHQFTSSMATLKTISNNREEKVRDFYQFFVDAMESAKSEPIKDILLVPGHDPQITAKLVKNMLIEEVEIKRATEEFTVRGAYSYFTRKTEHKTFPAGTYIIPLNQPQKVLIKTLLGPEAKIEDYFIEEERQRRADRERSHFYDITGWSMPLTYGLDAYASDNAVSVAAEDVTESPGFTGSVDSRAKQVYLIPYNTLASTKMMYQMMLDGVRVRQTRKEFTIDGKTWPVGTLVVRLNRNSNSPHSSLHEIVSRYAKEYGIDVTAVNSGLSSEGIDLGSGNIVPIQKPKIALVTESPTSSYSYGALHYLFEREMDLDFTRINVRNLANLDDYNVVVLPAGNYGRALSEQQINDFKRWIRRGGTVVAVSSAVNWMRSLKLSNIKPLSGTPDPEDKTKKIRIDNTPGAILKVNMNNLSFLSFGARESVATFKRSSEIYQTFADDKFKNIGVYAPADEVKLSGWVWPETEKYLAGNGWLFLERSGRGKVISFVEDPNFRASYDGLNKVFFNAVILGPSYNQ